MTDPQTIDRDGAAPSASSVAAGGTITTGQAAVRTVASDTLP